MIIIMYFRRSKVVPESGDGDQDNIFTITGGGGDGLDGEDKQVGGTHDQDVASVNKTDKNNAGRNCVDKDRI